MRGTTVGAWSIASISVRRRALPGGASEPSVSLPRTEQLWQSISAAGQGRRAWDSRVRIMLLVCGLCLLAGAAHPATSRGQLLATHRVDVLAMRSRGATVAQEARNEALQLIQASGGNASALNLLDFGAVSCPDSTLYSSHARDCPDSADAVQRAIDAAQVQGRQLFVPAGNYVLSKGLYAHCSAGSPAECKEENEARKLPGFDPAVGVSPLFLVGEATELSQFVAAAPMDSMLTFLPNKGVSTSSHSVQSVRFEAMGKANHTIYSKAITHSRFILLSVHDARVSGIELQYGWCNTVEDSSFNGNQIGVSVSNSANNFVAIDSWFEGNGIGIALLGSAQARIVGNVIEGNRAAGLVVTGVRGLTISGNYFEGNCQNLTNSPATLTLETGSHGQYLLNADIVLNGAAALTQLAPTYPTYSAIIEGSYHSPFPNGSAIAAVAVEGLIVRANSCGLCQNVSLLDVGTSASWSVADVSMEANTGAMIVLPRVNLAMSA